MELLEGVIRDYDWGSLTAIPEFLGVPATGEPQAELWLGAHPSAPSSVGRRHRSLDELVAAHPVGALGEPVAARFESLPFLLKVLAAAAPLSLQAHPSVAQAEAGFDRENSEGIALDAADRSFRDRSYKPELICALTPFEALCGFREPAETLAILATIPTDALLLASAGLEADSTPAGLAGLLRHLLSLGREEGAALARSVVAACQVGGPELGAPERAMAAALGARHPGDIGVVTALLLNRVTLQPGEALFLGAGQLHAYLHGTGIEIMANSDNVLRGGLTSKHVDVSSLLEVVDPTPTHPVVQRPSLVGGVATYEAPVPEFSLSRIEVDGEAVVAEGPAILLCTEGAVEAGPHTLERGAAGWMPAEDGPLQLSGRGTVFRAGVGTVFRAGVGSV